MDLSGSTSMDSSRNVPDKPGTSAGGGGSDALSSTRQPSLISSLWSIQVQHEGSNSDFPMESPKGSLPEIAAASSCCHFQAPQGPVAGSCASPHQLINAGGGDQQQQLTAHDHHNQQLLLFHHQQLQHQQTASSAIAAGGVGCSAGFHMPPFGNNPLRPVKSLSDLSSLVAAGGGQMSQPLGGCSVCPFSPCVGGHNSTSAAVAGGNSQYGAMNNCSNRRLTETGIFYGGGLSKQQRDSQICDWLQTAMLAMRVGESGGGGTSGSESPPEMGTQFGQPRPPTAQNDAGGQ